MTEHNPFSPPDADLNTLARDTLTEYVGFWPRLGASLIDSILILMITAPILYMVYGPTYFSASAPVISGVVDGLLSWVFPIIAITLFWIKKSATPGKMLIHAVIVDKDTLQPTTPGRLLLRYIGYYLSAIPLGLGFLWVAFDKRKQGWHDKIARTVVIRSYE